MSSPAQCESGRVPRLESFQLGSSTVPRLWVGLWQLSSTAWGSASAPKVRNAMIQHIEKGFNAFGEFFLISPCEAMPDQSGGSDMVRGIIISVESVPTGSCCVCYASSGWVDRGSRLYKSRVLTAVIVADHYGPAEILFGQVRESLPDDSPVLGATKWCVFKEIDPTREVVEAAVRDRMSRMRSTSSVDLLQVSNFVRRSACATLMRLVSLA